MIRKSWPPKLLEFDIAQATRLGHGYLATRTRLGQRCQAAEAWLMNEEESKKSCLNPMKKSSGKIP
jgi:hypothetical protein